MKKRIAVTILATIVGLFTFIGCSEDKPYSSYQIGITFQGVDSDLTRDEINLLPPSAEKDKLLVANFIASWMIDNRFIRTGSLGNVIEFEGDNELSDLQNSEINDQKALLMYDNQVIELNKVDLNEIIVDGQKKIGEDETPVLTLTTIGSVDFSYYMTGLQPTQTAPSQKSYTVSYAPLPVTPNP